MAQPYSTNRNNEARNIFACRTALAAGFTALAFFWIAVVPTSALAQSAGSVENVGVGKVLTEIGYGSDDHGSWMYVQTCEMNVDGSTDNCSGWKNGQNSCNTQLSGSSSGYCPDDQVLVGWSWSGDTGGGGAGDRCGNDSNPGNECYYQGYQSVNPATNLRTTPQSGWGAPNDGTCSERDYGVGDLKNFNRVVANDATHPYLMPSAIYFQMGDDAGVDAVYVACRRFAAIPAPTLQNPPSHVCIAGSPMTANVTLTWDNRGTNRYQIKITDVAAGTSSIQDRPTLNSNVGEPVTAIVLGLKPGVSYQFKVKGYYDGVGPDSRNITAGGACTEYENICVSYMYGDFGPCMQWENQCVAYAADTDVSRWSNIVTYTAACSPLICAGTISLAPGGAGPLYTCPGQAGSTTLTWNSTNCAKREIFRRKNGGSWTSVTSDTNDPTVNPQPTGSTISALSTSPDSNYEFELRGTSVPSGAALWPLDIETVNITDRVCLASEECSGAYPGAICYSSSLSNNAVGNTACVGQTITWTGTSNPSGNPAYWHTTGPVTENDIFAGNTPVTQNKTYTVAEIGNYARYIHVQVSGTHSGPKYSTSNTVNLNVVDGCFIGGACYANCALEPPSGPRVCDTAISRSAWTTLPGSGLCVNSNYTISFSGPGPESAPGKQTWLKQASGVASLASGGAGPVCSSASSPPSATCAMGLGSEILYTLNFYDPFTISAITCVGPDAPTIADNCAVLPGQPATFSVTLNNGTNGFTGVVDLSAVAFGIFIPTSWPGGAQCNFTAPNQNCVRTFQITPDPSSVAADYQLFVRASIPGSATVDSSSRTFKVWNFDFEILPAFQTANYMQTISYTVNSSGVNGFTKGLAFDGVSIIPAGSSFVPATNPLFTLPATPGSGTFQVLANGICGVSYTLTVRGRTTASTIIQKDHTAEFDILGGGGGAPVLSLFGPPTCSVATPPKRTISLAWSYPPVNPVTLQRSVDNFASIEKSYPIASGVITCVDEDGSACGVGTGSGLAARASSGQSYSYRLVGPACGAVSVTSNIVSAPSPDCVPSVLANSATSTITSWCSSGGGSGSVTPGVGGNVRWDFCDPDAPNWSDCAAGQTAPTYAFDSQSHYCVQISSDPNFPAAAGFNADDASFAGVDTCGNATTCGALPGGVTGCISGAKTGSTKTCSWGSAASCMSGTLTYNQRYYYRVKVRDADAWGGAPGPQWSQNWSCTAPNCPSFMQDHYIGDVTLTPVTVRAGVNTRFSATASLYNDDASSPFPRALYYPASEVNTWTFRFCDTGSDVNACSPSALQSSTGTTPTLAPPSAYSAGGWPVYCTSTDTALCPVGANRSVSNRGDYTSSGVKHTYPNEELFGIGVTILDNEGHACVYKNTVQVKQRVPLWYEIVPRQ
ncbi:MAG: fibronectin type III domain-containing protein [bacterium]|nr:fibronectin type III domain-containing protein [bacterium]